MTSKISIMAYIGTYYTIASAIPLTLANYLIVSLFGDNVDHDADLRCHFDVARTKLAE